MNLTLNEFVFGVVTIALLAVLMGTFVSRFLSWKEDRRISKIKVVCRICGHVFTNENEKKLFHCEVCDSLNRGKNNGHLG